MAVDLHVDPHGDAVSVEVPWPEHACVSDDPKHPLFP
jgi:hypothetical protein